MSLVKEVEDFLEKLAHTVIKDDGDSVVQFVLAELGKILPHHSATLSALSAKGAKSLSRNSVLSPLSPAIQAASSPSISDSASPSASS